MKDRCIAYLFVVACSCISFTQSYAQVKAAFSANPVAGCSPLVVQFHDESTGSATSWRWDLGNGTISLFQNPSTVYFSAGTYAVKLVVKNAAGADSVVKQQYITVYDNPVADFLASDSSGCFPLPVTFTDKSSVTGGTISKWEWDFGDGDTAIAQKPSHTYTGTGNFTVTLKVTSDKGCSKSFTKPQYIQITSGVLADFDYTPTTNSCSAPVEINFNNKSVEVGAVSYQWNFGDGQTSADKNPKHTYLSNGSYTVTLVAFNNTGCRDTLRKIDLLVLGNTTTQFTIPGTVCAGQPFFVTNTSTPAPASVQWDFGDGTGSTQANPQKSYPASGTYMVKLVNHFAACTDSLSRAIIVLPKPVASFTSDRTYACSIPASIQFTNTTAGTVGYSWDFGDGSTSASANPVHVYTSFGTYTVKLIVTGSNGCTDTIVKKDYITVKRPQVNINNVPVKGCLPLTIPFTATINVQDAIISYRWDFGDGTTSAHVAPVKTYTAEGNYTVKLVITTAGGCTDSVVVTDAVQAANPPQADFTANQLDVCRSTPIQFTNKSIPAGDAWQWIFGDGGTSSLVDPLYQFSDTGYFRVTLIVSNKGCSDTMVKDGYVHINPPVARFAALVNCADKYKRSFIDRSIAAQSWSWNFGDGTTGNGTNPVHTYTSRGIYRAKLVVTNNGCLDSTVQNIVIADEHPDFDADKKELCKEKEVAFTLLQYDPLYVRSLVWHFGDGAVSSTAGNVTHIYKKSGLYKVKLVYTDVNGCIDSTVKQQYIQVNGPSASFDVKQKICADSTVTFQDLTATDGIHPVVTWVWVYGDGTPDQIYTAPPFSHTYVTGNTYTVSLRVTDSYGCTDNVSKAAAIIVSDPKAVFTTADSNSCPGKPVNFANGSTGSGLQYTWDFGDGNTSMDASPVHQYQQEGLYTIHLKIVDPVGCRDSVIKTDFVKITIPVAQFTMSDSIGSCPPLQVTFTNGAKNYTTVRWDFGDGNTSTLVNPVHFYNIPGEYEATQFIEGPGGCTDVMKRKVIVKGPKGTFTYTPVTGCIPLKVNFTGTGNGIKSLVWDFNDGSTAASTLTSIEYTYNTSGKFVPRMILIDSAGCQVPVTGPDTINAIGVTAKAMMDTYRVCNSGYIQFTDQSVANDFITGHQWDFGDGTTSMLPNPKHNFSAAPATYSVVHTVTTANGCKDVMHLTDTIKVYATPQVVITGDKEACEPAQLQFNAVITGDAANLKKHWDYGNGQTSDTTSVVTHNFNAPGNYQVQLQTIYQDYCRDTARYNVSVWPLPNTFAGKDSFVCRGTPMQLRATGADQYTWNATTDISCTQCAGPLINPAANTEYVVTGVTTHGCIKKDTIAIRVRQPFTMQVQQGDTLCAGEQVKLSASGADRYQWTPGAGLDNTTSATPKASPGATTVYTVIGKDNDNCFADTGSVKLVVYPVPQIFAGNDTVVSTGSTIQLKAKSSADVTKWSWTPASTLSCSSCAVTNAVVKGSVTYRVTASNDGGCTANDDITVTAVCNEGNWFIPNTFSPNGDGVNDIFYVRGKGLNLVHSLRIFNRWGQAIFEKRDFMANDPAAGWDGKVNGKPADLDVYVYIVEVVCDNSNIVPLKGNVALVR